MTRPTIYIDAGANGALPGDNVALFLDTADGLELGAELVTNGTFDTDTDWANASTGTGTAVISGGILSITTDDSSNRGTREQSFATTADSFYLLEWDASGAGIGNGQVRYPGGIFSAAQAKGVFRATGATTTITLTTNSIATSDLTFDNVSVKSIAGQHAQQATTASQPVLGRAPKEVRNLLVATEALGEPSWNKANLTASGLSVREATADAIHLVDQIVSLSGDVTFTAEIAPVGRDAIRLGLGTSSGTYAVDYTFSTDTFSGLGSAITSTTAEDAGEGYTRIVIKSDNGANRFRLQLKDGASTSYAGDTAKGIDVRKLQIEDGSNDTAYQFVSPDGLDITEFGVPSYYYLRPDAVDDALPQVLPGGMTGDLMIFGRDGSWIDEGVTVAAGGTLTAINGANSPGMAGIIKALGDIVGWLPLDRTLTAWERSKLVSYFKDRGAKGLLVPNGVERVANGTFDTDFTGWVETGTVTSKSVTGGVASITADNLSGIKQDLDFSDGVGFYRISFDLLSTTGTVQIIANVSGSTSTLSPIYTSAGAKELVFEVGDGASGLELLIRSRANANTFEIDNVSVQKLVIQ